MHAEDATTQTNTKHRALNLCVLKPLYDTTVVCLGTKAEMVNLLHYYVPENVLKCKVYHMEFAV